jgi:hypothetical protein
LPRPDVDHRIELDPVILAILGRVQVNLARSRRGGLIVS